MIMKTIEEKAKAYDEAIAKAQKELQSCGSKDCDAARQIYRFFPELQESEDERIRKWLIRYFESMSDNNVIFADISLRDVLAWLEKQEGCEHIKKDWLEHIKQSWYKEGFIDGKYSCGTSKEWTINDAATLKELIDFLENGTAKLQHDLTRYAKWLKIQFTQIEKQGKQKPKWTEEDEKRLQSCISALQGKGLMGGVDTMDSKWLKSLKQRMGEHEKQDVQNLASSAKNCKNDTILDLLQKMPSYITVDGIFYHFMLRKTALAYTAYYAGEEEGSGKVIFAMTAFSPIDLLNEMLEILKEKGLLE